MCLDPVGHQTCPGVQAALEEFKHENPEYRWAMISARFDGGEVEQTFREVVRIMKGHGCNILMVDAKGGDDFGLLTIQYLNKIRSEKGVMVAVCTPHYGEKTASPYSSHQELVFAVDNKLEVLPLKVNEIYPPKPPCGPNHRFDNTSAAEGLISMTLPSTLPPMASWFDIFLDRRDKTVRLLGSLSASFCLALLRTVLDRAPKPLRRC